MARQLITFDLGGQSFGMDVMAIREIRAWTPTARVPHAPAFMVGVVNLRGTALPVLDLSSLMGWQVTAPTERHVIIVVEIAGHFCGLIVDAVSDIVTARDEDIQPPPATASLGKVAFLEGVVTCDERMVMIIDRAAMAGDVLQSLAA